MIAPWGAGAAIALGAAALASFWGARAAAGALAGGLWNLASLWCLIRLLGAWLGPQPSQRHVVGWLVVKFPLLYLGVFLLLRSSSISLIGFGIGFSLILIGAIGWFAANAPRLFAVKSDGR